jgi:hypothetical protein
VVRSAAATKQPRGKHVSAAANQHPVIEELMKAVFTTQCVRRVYQWDKFRVHSIIPCADRLCGLVVRILGYRSRGPGFDYRRYQTF